MILNSFKPFLTQKQTMRKIVLFGVGCLFMAISCKKNDIRSTPVAEENGETTSITNAAGAANARLAIQRSCAAHEVLQRQVAANPERGRRLDALERIIQDRSASMKGKPGGGGGETPPTRGLIKIPVIVHVVLPNAGVVSDNQIKTQLDVLNADFQKLNTELTSGSGFLGEYGSTVANCQIQFELQTTIRKNSTVNTFSSNDAVKFTAQGGSNAINPTTTLNMWVCDLSSGLLGYAQFPGGNAATDGVVVDYQAFGTLNEYPKYADFNKGRTATHEIGHWLNLRHIWGDSRCGDDLVGDTPQHDGANYGCPSTTDRSSCKGKTTYDMWMNYMDYTNDACMYMFTVKQRERIDLTLANARKAYYTSVLTP